MKRLLDMDWEYEDFPEEPLPLDGSLIHVIERAYPFFVQDAGYLTGWISTAEDAQVHITNLAYLYRESNQRATRAVIDQITGEVQYVTVVQDVGVKGALKTYLKKHMPATLWNFLKKIYYSLGGKPV